MSLAFHIIELAKFASFMEKFSLTNTFKLIKLRMIVYSVKLKPNHVIINVTNLRSWHVMICNK